jgi:hypothetical protein
LSNAAARQSDRRATEKRDEVAPFHCPVPPVLRTKEIAHKGLLRCGISIRSTSQRVISDRGLRNRMPMLVRFTSNSGQTLAPQRNAASCQ